MTMQDEVIEDKNKLLQAIESQDVEMFTQYVELLHYADLAEIYEDLSESERDFFTNHIGTDKFAEVLPDLPDRLIEETMDRLSTETQKDILEQVSDDDRVDILQEVSRDTRERLLELVTPDDIDITRSLLKYGKYTAGGRMTTHFGHILRNMTVKESIESLKHTNEETESLARIYVIDESSRLFGYVRFRDLVFNHWDTPIEQLIRPTEHTILATAEQEEAAKIVSKYDLLVLPVVDELDRLLGVITHDDALEIIEEESTEDIEKMAGFSGEVSEESYLNTRTLTHFRRRFPWVFGLALMAISSGVVMIHFESILSNLFILSLFLPMVVSAGGNTGGQAATMVIRAMALGELGVGSTLRVAWKELRLGLMLGSLIGVGIAAVTIVLVPIFYNGPSPAVGYPLFALSVAIALTCQVTTSTLVGSLLPIGARALKIDPAVIAAPAITTTVDVSGMMIYFFTAKLILGM